VTRYMWDSIVLADIPQDAEMVAVYGNGVYAVPSARVDQRFTHVPESARVYIDVNGTLPKCCVRDWEPGDKGGNLEQWVAACKVYNSRPTIYCDRSTIAQVRVETGTQVLGKDYWLWIATLDGTYAAAYPDAPTGVVAVQAWGVSQTGIHADKSVVFDDYWPLFGPVTPSPPVQVKTITGVTVGWSDGSVTKVS